MKSVVHYKFKSSKDCGQILFGGNVISVSDIKRDILKQTKMDQCKDWKTGAFELWLSDACTGQEYHDEKFMIQKNQTVIVKRIPKAAQTIPRSIKTNIIQAGIPRNFTGPNSKLFEKVASSMGD
jgi:hypothetical protein